MVAALEEAVCGKGRPFFGICVGMQLLAERGHEYETSAGLGWIAGEVDRVTPNDARLKIPHMGWNTLSVIRPHPLLAGLIDKTQKSPLFTPQERVKFFKLAWDALGSEFASRHVQYEMFYAGASFVTRGHSYRTFDWTTCTGMVDGLMARYPTPGHATSGTAAAE